LRRGAVLAAIAILGGGAWAVANRDLLQTRYAAHQLKNAATDDERARWAESLAARDPHELFSLAKQSDDAIRAACVAAVAKQLETRSATDPAGSELALLAIEEIAAGNESFAPLLPGSVQRCGAAYGEKCRTAVRIGLKSAAPGVRVAAIRAAIHPSVGLRNEVTPLLAAAEPEVRRNAMLAIGPASDTEVVIGDEELFRWLHDSDADVRSLCRAALQSRGRSDSEIALGKRLVDPDAGERLKLLLDLRYDDELTDVEPWLERLSHDGDPSVRAGAARVALELGAERMRSVPAWVSRLAEADSDLTVRRIVRVYRGLGVTTDVEIRLVDGP
jgi:hypothetical protein